jgi:hypothetical protein
MCDRGDALYESELNTKRPTIVFFLDPTKPLRSYDKASQHWQYNREMTGRTQTLPWWLGGEGVKKTKYIGAISLYILYVHATVCLCINLPPQKWEVLYKCDVTYTFSDTLCLSSHHIKQQEIKERLSQFLRKKRQLNHLYLLLLPWPNRIALSKSTFIQTKGLIRVLLNAVTTAKTLRGYATTSFGFIFRNRIM